jgi:hypothetical protein
MLQPDQIEGPETPKLLKDLGRDYSRYPFTSREGYISSVPGRSSIIASAPSASTSLRTMTTNPFSDSQANLEKWGYPDDSPGAFDPYFGGEKGFILYADEIEADVTNKQTTTIEPTNPTGKIIGTAGPFCPGL